MKDTREEIFKDTALPFRRKNTGDKSQGNGAGSGSAAENPHTAADAGQRSLPAGGASEESVLSEEDRRELDVFLDFLAASYPAVHRALHPQRPHSYFSSSGNREVPEKIQKMRQLYVYGESTPEARNANFYRMGKFMEDYTDDAPWNGTWHKYFPTYHDLNVRQLRGYFTWRTRLREGRFEPMCESVAYIYIYEILCGIGCRGPEEVPAKLVEFERGFLDAGYGTGSMRENVRRWRFEYAVVHALPEETVLNCADPEILWVDYQYSVLRNPSACSDTEVYSALRAFEGGNLPGSQAAEADNGNGVRLFAKAWRAAVGQGVFADCFGEQKELSWHPLANAVVYEEHPIREADYGLDECRSYICHEGEWKEIRYHGLYFDRKRLQAFLHECERVFRKYLKTGRSLRRKAGEEWVTPYAETAVREYGREKELQARPKIEIHFDGLDRIRRDAGITRDRLLTEEDLAPSESDLRGAEEPDFARKPTGKTAVLTAEKPASAQKAITEPESIQEPGPEPASAQEAIAEQAADLPLDALHMQILQMLLKGESPEALMKAHFLMPSVAADTINEVLFDEIGDSVVDCDGEHLALVEDYIPDVEEILALKAES